ncbi:helix-turn-helix transcriptional regulator [Phytomonospora endophytica]|uniref:Transcriptional regulator with XRE-family HTH domain n=1 Tax=Phytomonospora endophytica TaxID=714109 RepID=A0A841FZZ9_9ACTN|nr:helix-turn-helix transcriptional regulator [Phytomonospora endophytica]MBB6037490.1 transcriptional regulator with XRE-family HTH domain [Phytomonospora endophytica]
MTAADRPELADFLRRSRERLSPAEVGLPEGPRRRTPGLRRQEVAQLAGMSADYLMRLEQARSPQPSPQILAALGRALRLTVDERDHLYLLAGHRPPAGELAGHHIGPALMYLLDQLAGVPAQVVTDLGDVVAQNALAEAVFGCVCTVEEGPDRNIAWRWFTDPFVREAYPVGEHERHGREVVADLRSAVAKRRGDPAAAALLKRLRAASAEFAGLWERHEVAMRRRSRMRVVHPEAGAMEFDFEALLTPAEDQRLRVFTPVPGSRTHEALELLKVVGAQTAHRSHRS